MVSDGRIMDFVMPQAVREQSFAGAAVSVLCISNAYSVPTWQDMANTKGGQMAVAHNHATIVTSGGIPSSYTDRTHIVQAKYVPPGHIYITFRDGFGRGVSPAELIVDSTVLGRMNLATLRSVEDGTAVSIKQRDGRTYTIGAAAIRGIFDPEVRAANSTESKNTATVVGAHIASVRKSKGVSRKDVSDLSGVSIKDLSDIEAGRMIPKGSVLIKLAKAIGVTFRDMLPPN